MSQLTAKAGSYTGTFSGLNTYDYVEGRCRMNECRNECAKDWMDQ